MHCCLGTCWQAWKKIGKDFELRFCRQGSWSPDFKVSTTPPHPIPPHLTPLHSSDKLWPAGRSLGQVFNFRRGPLFAICTSFILEKRPTLKLKTLPKQLLVYLILAFVLSLPPPPSFGAKSAKIKRKIVTRTLWLTKYSNPEYTSGV